MASYLRPRRGKKATATSQLTASAPLKRGEIFFEVPDTGVGTGTGKIKMGDGTTAYASLPYFMEQPTVDYTNAVVAWTNTTAADSDPYSTNATYANNIAPSASLKTIFTNLKKLLMNYNSQLTTLNNDLVEINKDKDLDNRMDLSGYNSSDSLFTVPDDGIITLRSITANVEKISSLSMAQSDGSVSLITVVYPNSGSVFVKKGTSLYNKTTGKMQNIKTDGYLIVFFNIKAYDNEGKENYIFYYYLFYCFYINDFI